jgi:hypothetical protein
MRKLTRDQILAAPLKTQIVEVPQWDGMVTICEMPVAKRNVLLADMLDPSGNVKITPDIELKLFIAGMYEPSFEANDAAELQAVSSAAVSHVAKAIMALNGMSADSQDDARGES